MQRLFIFWIALLPFILWQGYYEGPKIIYFYIGSFLLFIFWIVETLKFKKYFAFTKADIFYLLWLVVLLVSSIIGVHPFESIIGGSYRHQGVLFFFSLWVVGKTVSTLDKNSDSFLVRALSITIIVESLLMLFQYSFGKLYFGKPLGTIGEANAAAGFLAIGSGFLDANYLWAIFIVFVIFLTRSKSGLFAALVTNIYLLVGKVSKKKIIFLVSVVLMASIAVGYIYLGNKIRYLIAPASSLWHLESEDRVLIWRMGIDKILQKPIFGWGAESSEVVFYSSYKESGMPLLGIAIDRAHNLFLDILMWSGVVGLGFFLVWLWKIFKYIKRLNFKLAFFAFLIFSFFQPLSIVHWILIIIIVNI